MTHTTPTFTAIGTLLAAGALSLAGTTASADQVILDDLIVDGSACIGQDCVNGESFGFDTIRIKENNLRIKAQDTSTTASFPTQDWQITFNDSSNGGANKFSIDAISPIARTPFTIEDNARANAIYVDGSNVGFGTSTPVVNLHVRSGNTPTLRLEQDGSSGFTAQTWDLAGNEANFFIRDATNGSQLPVQIKPGADTGSLFIAADGDVGMGTTSPSSELEVEGSDGNVRILLQNTSATGAVQFRLASDAADNRRILGRNAADSATLTQILLNDTSIQLTGPDATTDLWATINAAGITTQGPDCATPCDAVFDPELYTVPPMEEYAAFMWENKHLPSVGPTGPDHPFNVTEKVALMLNELEHAHIYIDQLNTALKAQAAEIELLKERIAAQ